MQHAQAGADVSARDWRASVVSDDATHHLIDGAPMYAVRFTDVLKFHAPGLAPVRDDSGAYHVDVDGRPAYAARFVRTFGFYEGLAAVATNAGWAHIRVDGAPLATSRWAWAGNFQGGRCPVRDDSGWYRHILADGTTLNDERWRYAGDFRDGVAVVQAGDGRSTHLDASGRLLHGRRFLDLDVFHKGFARARDEGGWMHIDSRGDPIYGRRFAMVEPFYNGQARVERFDGALEVIEETGGRLAELRPPRRSALHAVSAELVSFWRCESIFAAVELGVFDRLPLAEVPDDRFPSLLHALAELGLVTFERSTWVSTELGAVLSSKHPSSLAAAARYWAGDGRRPWADLRAAMADPSWRAPNPFAEVASSPERVAAFHAALTPYAEVDYAEIAGAIDPGFDSVVDAGGGTGALAKALLRGHRGASAIVMDRPEVVALGSTPADLAGRLAFVPGDLFAPWAITADVVVLARVLHDWDDGRCIEILRRARAAAAPCGRIYIVEMVRAPEGFEGGLLSLHVLLSTGGKERTRAEFEGLIARADLRLREVREIGSISRVLVVEVA